MKIIIYRFSLKTPESIAILKEKLGYVSYYDDLHDDEDDPERLHPTTDVATAEDVREHRDQEPDPDDEREEHDHQPEGAEERVAA